MLCYRSDRDGCDVALSWEKCKNFNEAILIFKTNFGWIFGFYMPQKWQKQDGVLCKGNYFLFYFDNLEIKICKLKNGKSE